MLSNSPNFNNLYLKGADIVDVDPSFSAMLFAQLMSEEFSTESSYGASITNPIWDREYNEREEPIYIEGKKPYAEFFKEVIKSPYFDYWRNVYGEFDEIHVNVNKVMAGGEMPWHFDGYDGTFLQILCYPNMDDFNPDDGGHLLVGRPDTLYREGDPMPHWVPEKSLDDILTSNVEVTQRFVPNRNQIVVLNNNDPSFVHRVTKLSADKTRYTIIATLGFSSLWKTNTLKSGFYKDIQLL
jgi:hypothetical protein